ncbi:MAG: phosphatase PAP2 family protein [Alphaproteobacteria bacterium]|nr:phosphatase PAP2 family protein [Alphaproteobacteria bacterium]MBV9014683.1 phosphatase PAP2 family protein [Alphaproteobacteria bacterium]MBV9150251.1 phosphatase PAP2 family protein [Alphaproteobacteria bacterium]MBV9585338.1 phosphatase PAP2 family protein [Alphaproteobacteria bacterium]MBV9966164.1 phosphatase PAP2 family protein [Alphaproteobacteria bacterium]
MTGVSTRVWLLLAGLAGCDFLWCAALKMGLSHWWPLALASLALLGLTLGCRLSGAGPRIAAIAEWILLWLIFSVAGALLTYLAAAQDRPVYDARLALADADLGFHWAAWLDFVVAHPVFKLILAVPYHSLVAQVVLSIVWLSWCGRDDRNAELLINTTLALLMTTAVFFLFPTLGPCVGVPACQNAYLEDLVGLRHGSLPSLDIMLLKGVIPFPSFHAVLAMLFTYAHRGSRVFVPVAAFNTLMLLSIPSEGGHYLVDVLGGVAVGGLAILMTRVLPARAPELTPATTG